MNHAMGSKNQILKKKDRCLITESSFQPQELSLLTTALDINDVCSLYIMTDLIRIFVFSCIMGLIILTTLWPIIFQLSLFSFSHTVFILLLHHNAQCVCMHACMCVYEREGELFFWVWLIFLIWWSTITFRIHLPANSTISFFLFPDVYMLCCLCSFITCRQLGWFHSWAVTVITWMCKCICGMLT